MPPVDAVVIGGGLAGLTAAVHLAERGLAPLVLEADARFAGGRVAGGETVTLEHGGRTWTFRGEHGVHGIWSPYRNLQAMLARNGLRPAFVPAQEEDWIYKRGDTVYRAGLGRAIRESWIPAPFHYLNLFLRPGFLRMLTPGDWASLFLVWYGLIFSLGIDPLGEERPLTGHYLSELMHGWSPSVRAFWTGLARNGLSAQPEEIPLAGFIGFLRFYTLRRRDSWNFTYFPADGGTSLIDPLVARIEALGGRVVLGRRVTQIARAGEGWRVAWAEGEVTAPAVILAVEAPAAQRLLQGSADTAEQAARLMFPRGLETAVVRLWFDTAPSGGAEGGMFNEAFTVDNFFWLHRIQDQYAAWHRVTGGSALELHIYGPPAVLAQPDAILLAHVITDVQSAFPELRGHRIHQVMQRNSVPHTLFTLGTRENHLGTETPWPGLYCCGDWVRHRAPAFFLERATLTGIAAANAVLEKRGLAAWPLLDYPQAEAVAGGLERLMRAGRRLFGG